MRIAPLLSLLLTTTPLVGAELTTLSASNYQTQAPKGKEVDAIYGDYVLRNDWLVAVVAAPGEERDANLTVRNVGGSIIDLTARDQQSDQLSAFYPGGGAYRFDEKVDWMTAEWGRGPRRQDRVRRRRPDTGQQPAAARRGIRVTRIGFVHPSRFDRH